MREISESSFKIHRRNLPFPLWNNITSAPQCCTLCWSDSLPTCHVWDPSCHLSLTRSIGTRLIPHTPPPLHTHAHEHTAVSFLPFPPPSEGFSIYLFPCMRSTRQSKTDSSGFKLVRREQILFSLMVQLTTGWVFLLGKCSLQEPPVKGQLWKHRSSDREVSLPGARSLLREGWHCFKCSALSSFSIGEALQDSSNTAIPLPTRRRMSAFLFQCNMLTVAHSLKLTKIQHGNGMEKQLDCMLT